MPGRSFFEPTWYQTLTADERHAMVLVDDDVQAVGQACFRV